MEFTVNNYTYRIKKMNAIELLALRSTIDFDDYEKLAKSYETLLTKVEVQFKGNWLQIKQNNDYYPAELEFDPIAVQEIIKNILSYISSVFQPSSSSKTEQD